MPRTAPQRRALAARETIRASIHPAHDDIDALVLAGATLTPADVLPLLVPEGVIPRNGAHWPRRSYMSTRHLAAALNVLPSFIESVSVRGDALPRGRWGKARNAHGQYEGWAFWLRLDVREYGAERAFRTTSGAHVAVDDGDRTLVSPISPARMMGWLKTLFPEHVEQWRATLVTAALTGRARYEAPCR